MQNYPDPTAGEGAGPFYSSGNNQHAITNPDELQLAAQLVASAGAANPMQDVSDTPRHANHNTQYPDDTPMQEQMTPGAIDQSSYLGDSSSAPRKRSKVSRACDECRRKKIRCDATSESGNETCSNCRRVGAKCQFSRIPMKRGPSKGYIKELADRLNTLENNLQSSAQGGEGFVAHPYSRHASRDASPLTGQEGQQERKSGYGNEFSPPAFGRSSGWSESRGQMGGSQSGFGSGQQAFQTTYEPNGISSQPHWQNRPEAELLVRPSSSYVAATQNDATESAFTNEAYEEAASVFYREVQPVLPILPNTIPKLTKRLQSCSSSLREAFLEALSLVAQSVPSPDSAPYVELPSQRRASDLIYALQTGDSTSRNNLLYIQTLLLLTIAAGFQGPAAHSAPNQAAWIGNATSAAYQLKLHIPKVDGKQDQDGELDERLERRVWLSLVILDRFNASGTSSPPSIPDAAVVLANDEAQKVGETLFQMTRLSLILGQVTAVTVYGQQAAVPMLVTNPIPPTMLSGLLSGMLERFRETFPEASSPSSAPICHVTYWHIRLLIARTGAQENQNELLTSATEIVKQLCSSPRLVSPFNYYFTTLSLVTLVELLGTEYTRESAEHYISLLDNGLDSSGSDAIVRKFIIKNVYDVLPGPNPTTTPATSQHAMVASQGLQQLAELATGTEGGSAREAPSVQKNSYLDYVFAEATR